MTETLPSLLVKQAEARPNEIALREKEDGIWKEETWQGYLKNVKELALGLFSLGLRKGEKVCFIFDNRPQWLYTELAAMAIAAIPFGIYSDMEDLEGIQYLLGFSDAKFVIVENQEQTDKVLAIKERLPQLKGIIVDDFDELRGYSDPLLMEFSQVQERGRVIDNQSPDLFRKHLERLVPDDIVMLSTTSGTTSRPKLAMLTHKNLITMARGLNQVDPSSSGDNYFSFLPPAWIGEREFTIALALVCGLTVNFPEKSETVQRDMREIGPQTLLCPPRIWEKMVAEIQVKMIDSTPLKKKLFHFFMRKGEEITARKFKNSPITAPLKIWSSIGWMLVYRKIIDHLGISRCRHVYTGGAALGPDVFKFFQSLGLNIKQLYGQTEVSGISVAQRDNEVKLETVGKPLPGTEIKISDEGEILTRGEVVFKGYYKRPEATAEALRDGWMHSGDQGYLDGHGHLIIIDRLGEVMKLSDGSKFSPQFIENKLKFSPYIREAIVIGDGREYVAALIQIDMVVTGKWAESHQIPHTTFRDLSQKKEIYALIKDEVQKANSDLPKVARVNRFILLDKELDAEDGEITQTQKVRRRAVTQKYEKLIEVLYSNEESEEAGRVRYQPVAV